MKLRKLRNGRRYRKIRMHRKTCPYCQHSSKSDCAVVYLYHGFECTREKGHNGSHVACSVEEHDIETWPNR